MTVSAPKWPRILNIGFYPLHVLRCYDDDNDIILKAKSSYQQFPELNVTINLSAQLLLAEPPLPSPLAYQLHKTESFTASNSRSAGQEILRRVWKIKVRYLFTSARYWTSS